MPGLYLLIFLPEGRTRRFSGSCGNYYRLGDGSELELYSEPVWCHRCGGVAHGEDLGTVERIDRWVADLERLAAEIRRETTRPPLPAPDAPGDRHQRARIAELMLRRAWRASRRSPPRCIFCGTTEITLLEHGKPVRAGRQSFVVLEVVIGHCGRLDNGWYFTAEGERIAGP